MADGSRSYLGQCGNRGRHKDIRAQQKIKIPAKTVVKFRVAKAAKDAVLGVKK